MAISDKDLRTKAAMEMRTQNTANSPGAVRFGATAAQATPQAAPQAAKTPANTFRIDSGYNPEAGTMIGGYSGSTIQGGTTGGSGVMTKPRTDMAGMTGVRNAMTAAGLDNSKIGWNNGYVTYNGANFMQPAKVTDGVSYASQADFDKAFSDYMASQGMTGVRNAMTGAGFDNSKIGWENGNVTYDGANFMTPPYLNNGTTYASQADINNAINGYMGAKGMTGVRNAISAAGLDSDKIGWNNGYVTYDGQNLMKPSTVLNGTSYASQEDIDKALKGYLGTQGLLGIRETLNARGITNDRIGWNPETGMVTIDGKDAYKPDTNINGTTYAQDTDVNKLTDTAYTNSGDPIQLAKQYAATFGLQNAVHWADGKLTIGGLDVPVMYNQDGNAYARQSDIDKAIAQVKENSGIIGNKQVYDNWKDEYGDRIDDVLDKIINRGQWSYDPYKDPAFLAYRDAYTREGNRAYQDAYASMAANTGGYGSSASSTAAGQQLNYYMQQLGDRIPELEQDSYYRWYNDQQLNREALNSLISAADSDYNKLYQANRDAINDTNNANYYNYLRDIDARNHNRDVYESDRDFNYDKEVKDREWAYQEQLNKNAVTQSNIDTVYYERLTQLGIDEQQLKVDAQRLENNMAQIELIATKYAFGGDINKQISPEDAAALGISPKKDGTYPTIMDVQVAYTLLENAQTTPYYTQATQQMQMDAAQKAQKARLEQLQQQQAAAAVLKGGTQAVLSSGAFSTNVTTNIAAAARSVLGNLSGAQSTIPNAGAQ